MYDEERKKKKQEKIDKEQWKGYTVRGFMALKDLMNLLDENEFFLSLVTSKTKKLNFDTPELKHIF